MVETMTRDPPTLEMIKNNEPAVRNDLVMLFSSQDNASLLSPDGKEKLRNAASRSFARSSRAKAAIRRASKMCISPAS